MIRERVAYSSYGVPQASPPGDLDNDSDCDAADVTLWNTLSAGAYDVRADLTLDGVVDTSDYFLIVGAEIQGVRKTGTPLLGTCRRERLSQR